MAECGNAAPDYASLHRATTLSLDGGMRPRKACGGPSEGSRPAAVRLTFGRTSAQGQGMSTSQERSAAASFVERHGLWSEEQFAAAKRAEALIEEQRLEVVRLSFPDQHGILRGKQVMAADAVSAMRNGVTITTTLLAKDTSQRSVFAVFTPGGGFGMEEMQGGADFLMIPD